MYIQRGESLLAAGMMRGEGGGTTPSLFFPALDTGNVRSTSEKILAVLLLLHVVLAHSRGVEVVRVM